MVEISLDLTNMATTGLSPRKHPECSITGLHIDCRRKESGFDVEVRSHLNQNNQLVETIRSTWRLRLDDTCSILGDTDIGVELR